MNQTKTNLMNQTKTNLISSQRYLDDETVEAKRESKNYTVTTYDLTVNGVDYEVVINGHHALAAALADGVEPQYVAAPREIASGFDYVIELVGVETWLEQNFCDSSWYNPITGHDVW